MYSLTDCTVKYQLLVQWIAWFWKTDLSYYTWKEINSGWIYIHQVGFRVGICHFFFSKWANPLSRHVFKVDFRSYQFFSTIYNYWPLLRWICSFIDPQTTYWPTRSGGQYVIFAGQENCIFTEIKVNNCLIIW